MMDRQKHNRTASSMAIDRRKVLRGAGVTIALPLMESLLPASVAAVEQVSRTPRLATIAEPFGVVQDRFFPKTTGADYEMSPTLEPLQRVKSDFTVFSNLDHGVRGGHQANHTLWSGIKNTDRASYPDGNITVDQRAAELVGHNTRYPSLVFWTEKNSYTRTGVSVPAIQTPSEAFNLMFVNDTAEKRKFDRETIDASGSILDTVLADAHSFKRKLGRTDRKKMEEYFDSIRETEKKLELAESWIDKPKPGVSDPTLQKIGTGARDEKTGGNLLGVWLDLMHLALRNDSTRVVSMAINNCNWGLDGVVDTFHTLSHHGQLEEKLSQLAIVETFMMENLAVFIERLKSTEQPDGSSMLDSTQVLFGSGLGSGSLHSNTNLPIILAGGGFKHGQHIDGQQKQPLCNLFLSVLQQIGAEQDYFNRSNGTFTGLET